MAMLVGLAKRLGEVDRKGTGIAVQDHRAIALPRCCVTGRGGKIAIHPGRDRNLASRQAGRPDRLEGARDVKGATTENRIGPGRAEVVGALEQYIDDLLAGQVGEGLRHQRHRPADGRRREAGPGPVIFEAVIADRAVTIADRGKVIGGARSGAV
jgi:hypothetical protein